jgi:hypothetical protein
VREGEMNWKSLIFWKSKQEEVKPALYSNTDFARDLLTQIQHKSKSNQKEIVAMLFSQVFDDAHIHLNPRKRTTPDIAT